MTLPRVINLEKSFATFDEAWQPRIAGQVNDQHVKLTKLRGGFDWHAHAREDEMFLVTKGVLRMEFRDGEKTISEGEFIIVPRGVEHRPVTVTDEVHVLLIERDSVVNTGDGPPTERTYKPTRLA